MENLGIDTKLLIAQVINFVLFFLIIKKFVAKPFIKFIDQEKQKEADKQKTLVHIQEQEQSLKNKEKELQVAMKKEMDKIILLAKKEAQKVKEVMIGQAKKEVEELKINAKKSLEQEKESLYSDVKQKISDLAFLIVNEALIDSLNEESKKVISQKILEKLDKKVSLYEN